MNPNKRNVLKLLLTLFVLTLNFSSCKKEQSVSTGWEYNNPRNGGFEVVPYREQETGPGLVLIEGGTFTMGRVEQDVMYDWNNIPRRMTVSSFYMDQTEVRNIDYLEYLYWLGRVFSADYPEIIKKSLPDTLVWRRRNAYNEPFIELYLRHPSYREYPVVGVSWQQATDYCIWRTDRVNEYILLREGILNMNTDQINEDNFNTDAYLAGQYEGSIKDNLKNLNPSGEGTRIVRMEDGILLPRYRLPTEAEWEYAAIGLVGNTIFENITERRLYPWNGHVMRNSEFQFMGDFMANFVRGRGDHMGTAGRLNDNADVTAPVTSYWPNDYGLYNMAGNVSEWVMDVYRPLSLEDVEEFRSFRGNVFKTQERNEEGELIEKDSLGRVIWRDVSQEESRTRRNYKYADNRSYLDGDQASSLGYNQGPSDKVESTSSSWVYDYSVTSLINDRARVFKGGSWRDRAYWLVPGTRRFLDQDQSTDYIGFRCAMIRVGSPVGF
ncbi:MAG: gliding motility lipoprotein GldJ [Bacteroidetes bacterium GWE2_29_8]|nr:MAG: gliding motility lipoprotein GldJ [Bacteroidetes bacterium GWE2_29_8]OFY23062.1 MAG: gliding motility lipoprotein GldJ [Bacteroidetes bacterium GWF2_29_10]